MGDQWTSSKYKVSGTTQQLRIYFAVHNSNLPSGNRCCDKKQMDIPQVLEIDHVRLEFAKRTSRIALIFQIGFVSGPYLAMNGT